MRSKHISLYLGFAATIVLTALMTAPVSAQDGPVDLPGIWWAGAPTPLLPGESPPGPPPPGRRGVVRPDPALTDYAQAMIAEVDPADDPAVLCVNPGLIHQITSPYPVEVVHRGDTVMIDYEEWDVQRTIHLNAEVPENLELSSMGYSVGHYENARLVVSTTGLSRGFGSYWISEESTVVERYSLTERGQLHLEIEWTDPVTFTEPWHIEKTWNPYDGELLDFDCILRPRPPPPEN